MTIQKGKYYYCFETVIMRGVTIKVEYFTKGKVYYSAKDGQLTDNQGHIDHNITGTFAENHFVAVDDVIEAYTKSV